MKSDKKSNAKTVYDVIIIGGGFAGYSAAIYCARYNLNTLVIAKQPGGAIINATNVENYPGYASISGFELMQKFEEQAKKCGAEMIVDDVVGIIKDHDDFKVETEQKEFLSRTVILCMGTERRKLDIPNAKEFESKGIHYCATCDAAFYKGKTVAVIGGSNSAAHAALLLSRHAKKVYIIYRGDNLRCEPVLKEEISNITHAEVLCGFNVVGLKGKKFLESITLDIPFKGSKELELEGLFVEIGSVPSSAISKQLGVELTKEGEIKVNIQQETNVKGVFAAGDVVNTPLRQGIIAAAQGVKAATSAYVLLTGNKVTGSWS
jgi:thioredoxin-disulfide reductase